MTRHIVLFRKSNQSVCTAMLHVLCIVGEEHGPRCILLFRSVGRGWYMCGARVRVWTDGGNMALQVGVIIIGLF